MKRLLRGIPALTFSLLAYIAFAASLAYLVAFLLDASWLPNSVDRGALRPTWLAVVIDLSLVSLFGLQHSVMARPWFKRRWTRIVPEAVERSAYVMISSALTFALCLGWQPISVEIWSAESLWSRALWWGACGTGIVVQLVASFQIDHFELLGLRQSWRVLSGERPRQPVFLVRGLYRLVRHPIYTGWLLLFWFAPTMTAGHLLLAAGMTVYILVALRFEERDLIRELGSEYAEYRNAVPALLPSGARARASTARVLAARAGHPLVLLVLFLGVGAPGPTHAGTSLEELRFESGGLSRRAVIFADDAAQRPTHLMLMLHGAGGNPDRIRRFTGYSLETAAAAHRWIVAYPEGIGATWNDCRRTPDYPAKRQQVDDVAFLADLVDRLRNRYDIPASAVIAGGFSNGAQMVMRLAIERPASVGAIVVVAAQMPTAGESSCGVRPPSTELHSLWVHGTEDPFLPWDGGTSRGPGGIPLGMVESVEDTLAAWRGRDARRAGASAASGLTGTEHSTTRTWCNRDNSVMQHIALEGAGHVIPGQGIEFPTIAGSPASQPEFLHLLAGFVATIDSGCASTAPG